MLYDMINGKSCFPEPCWYNIHLLNESKWCMLWLCSLWKWINASCFYLSHRLSFDVMMKTHWYMFCMFVFSWRKKFAIKKYILYIYLEGMNNHTQTLIYIFKLLYYLRLSINVDLVENFCSSNIVSKIYILICC